MEWVFGGASGRTVSTISRVGSRQNGCVTVMWWQQQMQQSCSPVGLDPGRPAVSSQVCAFNISQATRSTPVSSKSKTAVSGKIARKTTATSTSLAPHGFA